MNSKLYVVVIDNAASTDNRLMTIDDAWQGQLPNEYIVDRFGYRGMREFVETHGYIVPANLQDDFEESLNADDRIIRYWADEVRDDEINAMPWQA